MRRQSDRAGFAVVLPLAEMTPESLRPPPRRADRCRARMVRFVVWETVAVAAMILSAILGTSDPFLHPSLNRVFSGLLVLSASAVALIPVFFFCLPAGFLGARARGNGRASQRAACGALRSEERSVASSTRSRTRLF